MLAEEFLRRADDLANDILDMAKEDEDEAISNSNVNITNNTVNTVGSNNNNFSPIKHNKQTASSSTVINNDMDDTPIILEDARKAIERLRILNSIDNKEDGMDVEPPPPPPSPPPQSSSLLRRISTITLPEQTIKTNEQIAKFLYALHLVENSELLNEIFRLHSIQIEEMPTFDFIALLDAMDGIDYDLENLFILLKALVSKKSTSNNNINILNLISMITAYSNRQKEALIIQKNKKQNQVNRRRQSWIDKYEKKNRSNNMMEGEIKLNNNRRHNNDDKMQKKQMPASVLTPPPPPPPPPPITIEM